MATDGDEDQWQSEAARRAGRHAGRWAVAVAACVAVVMAGTFLHAPPHLTPGNAEGAAPRVGLLVTGTPLDIDLRRAFRLAVRQGGAEVLLLEGAPPRTPEGAVAAFTALWRAGVRVFLAGGGALQMEALCRHLQHTGNEALIVSLTADADTPSCSSSNSSLVVSLSPPPAALVAAEVAWLAQLGVTRLVPVLAPSRTTDPLLSSLRAAAVAINVTVVSPVYLDAVSPSVRQLSQVVAALPGAAVWLAANHHLPHLMPPLMDALYGRLVMLHAHPLHLAALLAHPVARSAAETCFVTTLQWAGPTTLDDPAHLRLLAALTPTDPLASALAYHAAIMAIDTALTKGPWSLTQLRAHVLSGLGKWDGAPPKAHAVRPAAGWAARLRLVPSHQVGSLVMQDSPWLLEGMSWVHEGGGPSSWMVRESHAPARLLTREEAWQLGQHAGCGSLASLEVRVHDPLNQRPVVHTWPLHAVPDLLLLPNFSPRGFSVRARCPGHATREVEVGCQGAAAHKESLRCVMVASGGARQRREVSNFITQHGLPVRRDGGGGGNLIKRKIKGFFKHPDFRAFVPQIGGCLGATAGCSLCFVFILGRNVTINPGVCLGACGVAVGASCSSLVAKGVEYQMSNTVVCTELFTQGQLSWDSYVADATFGARLATTNPRALRGYRLVARPLVAAMEFSPRLTSLVEVLVRPWIRHMEYEEGVAVADDPVGRLMTALGLPLCSAVALLRDHLLTATLLALMTLLTRHVILQTLHACGTLLILASPPSDSCRGKVRAIHAIPSGNTAPQTCQLERHVLRHT